LKLYAFDGIDERLELLPLAARRALDLSGQKLSRAGWLNLPLDSRRAIVELGEASSVDVQRVIELCARAVPAPDSVPPTSDPSADEPAEDVVRAFGPGRPITGAVWSALPAVDRYALGKIAAKPRPERLQAAYDELIGASALSTHLSPSGDVRMVDVGSKSASLRRAVAESQVTMGADAFSKLSSASAAKGDVLGTARLAGIMAAKRTPELIPLCHGISLTHVSVELTLSAEDQRVRIVATAETFDRTGVEMEALVAANVAALTVYDMLKAYDRSMEVGPTRLLSKSGGRSGDFRR